MINYIKNKKINLDLSISNDFIIGESIVCVEKSLNISMNKRYEALLVYKTNGITIVQVIDDGNQISGYDIKLFKSTKEYRNDKLKNIFNLITSQ